MNPDHTDDTIPGPRWHRIKCSLAFWAITLCMSLIIVPVWMLCMLNPFWFRSDFAHWVSDLMRSWSRWRAHILKPMHDRYKLFDVIKTTVKKHSRQSPQAYQNTP